MSGVKKGRKGWGVGSRSWPRKGYSPNRCWPDHPDIVEGGGEKGVQGVQRGLDGGWVHAVGKGGG